MQTDYPDPFPLYYREKLVGSITRLRIVAENQALKLQAIRDFEDKKLGDEWIVNGPFVYIPKVEVKCLKEINATIIGPN